MPLAAITRLLTHPPEPRGVPRTLVEGFVQQSLAFGPQMPKLVEAVLSGQPVERRELVSRLLETLTNIKVEGQVHLVEDVSGKSRPLAYRDGKPAIRYLRMGDLRHPADAWTDNAQALAKAYLQALEAMEAAKDPASNPNTRVASQVGLDLVRWMRSLPPREGIILHEILMAIANCTREIPADAKGIAALLAGLDGVLGSWEKLKGVASLEEWQALKDTQGVVLDGLKSGGLRTVADVLNKIGADVTAGTTLYMGTRRLGTLTPIERAASIASGVMCAVAALEKKPGQLYWLQAIGLGMRALTVEKKTRLKWTRPAGWARGLIRLGQAMHRVIIPHIKNPVLKKFAAGLLMTDLRVYQKIDEPHRRIVRIHEDLKKIKSADDVPDHLGWLWNSFAEDEKTALLTAGKIPEWLAIKYVLPDQPVFDRLFGEWKVLATIACTYPEAWETTKNVAQRFLSATGLSDRYKIAGVNLWCRWVKTLAGVRDREGTHFTKFIPFVDAAGTVRNIDRLEVKQEGDHVYVEDVEGETFAQSTRSQWLGVHGFVELLRGTLKEFWNIEPEKLPLGHRRLEPHEQPKGVLGKMLADKNPPVSIFMAFQQGGLPHALRAVGDTFGSMLGGVMEDKKKLGDAERLVSTVSDICYQALVARPSFT